MNDRRRDGGFTFVEIMIALLIGVVAIAGLFRSFNTLHKWWISAGARSEQRQSARVGLETLTRDLEMAGYQTTGYGDAHKIGIAITYASAREIEVDQQRPRNDTIQSATPVYEPRLVYYHVATDMRTGRQNLYRQIRLQPGVARPDELVAENVSLVSFGYFDADGNPVPGLPPALPNGSAEYSPGVPVAANSPLRAIRRIQVTLTAAATRPMPIGPDARDFTMTASVIPQNLAAADEITADVTPPLPPAGLAAFDTGSCAAKLRVRWDARTEPDLAGYTVYFGPTDWFTVPLASLSDRTHPEVSLNPEYLLPTRNADRATAPNVYTLRVAAYDSAGNVSPQSDPISGNPSPDARAFGGVNDTTINPLEPSPPTGLSVAPGAGGGELVVTWAAPLDGSATAGFRLYRSPAPFASGHVDESLLVADERALGPLATTWTDSGLLGCSTYYYALASVNCDETLVPGYQHDSGNPALGDYAVASGAPTDGTPPPAPGLACVPGAEPELLLTLENPLETACADFVQTRVFWSTAGAPPADGSGVPIPDSDGGGAGTFAARGSQVVVFDSEGAAVPSDPALTPGATYHLLALSYDQCGNVSAPASVAVAVPAAPDCVDVAPGAFSASAVSTCQADAATLAWTYPDRTVVADHAGFRIWRPYAAEELTAQPTAAGRWTDPGPLVAGDSHTYTIKAVDCVYENNRRDPATYPLPAGYLPPPTVELGPVLPGGLRRYVPVTGTLHELDPENFVTTVSDASTPRTYHNNVKLWLQNTSRSAVTVKRMAVTWGNPNVVLASVTIGGASGGMEARTVDAGGVASGVAFSVGVSVTDTATGTAGPSQAVPLVLRFTLPDGTVNRIADMRREALGLSLWTWNESFADVDCASATEFAVDVPRGPVLGGFTQSAPGPFGIDSYEVVGSTGTARDTDIRVPYGVGINVYGTAIDTSRDLFADGVNRGFAQLQLVGVVAAPAAEAATPLMPAVTLPASAPGFERALQSVGGERYAIYRSEPTEAGALMPQVSDAVVWYYALAVDRTGNWDRAPNPDHGNYAYFSPYFDPCAVSPRAPVLTLESATPTAGYLSWTVPTEYDNGVPFSARDSLTYDVYVKGSGSDPWPSTPTAAGLAGTTYTHNADLQTGTYYYMVRARNSCASGPRPSADSNTVKECVGSTGVDCTLFVVPATANFDQPFELGMGGPCAFADNGIGDVVVFRVTANGATTDFAAYEQGDAGTFSKQLTAVWSGATGDSVNASSGSLSVSLVHNGAVACGARTVTLAGGECYTIPRAPTSFTAVRGTYGSRAAVLTWVRPTSNTDGSALTDLAGYEVAAARCTRFADSKCETWATWAVLPLADPAAQTYTWTGLTTDERYKFRVRAKDRCATPNFSAWSAESGIVRIR